MSWIFRNLERWADECDCPGACDCKDQRDPQIVGAWQDHDETTNRLRAVEAQQQPARTTTLRAAATQGRGATPHQAPRPNTPDKPEAA